MNIAKPRKKMHRRKKKDSPHHVQLSEEDQRLADLIEKRLLLGIKRYPHPNEQILGFYTHYLSNEKTLREVRDRFVDKYGFHDMSWSIADSGLVCEIFLVRNTLQPI